MLDKESGRLYPKADTPVLNFHDLKEILLSRDLTRLKEIEWTRSEPARFLDNTVDMSGNRVALTSYPRSGNALVKKFLEAITGVTTGSELESDILLQCAGFMGEGHAATDRIWVSKSHHPMNF